MIYALRERIGDPSLFCGRREQLDLLLDWADKIPGEISKSRALPGRRKCGKTALMQRLFNILWNRNDKVIPLYVEVLDTERWLLDFSDTYFRTFLSQYFSFKNRTLLSPDNKPLELSELMEAAKPMNSKKLSMYLDSFQGHLAAQRERRPWPWPLASPG
ncbi:MAG: hypothetical protein GY862_12845 [Gammaproteobacteria bacterium]|nr:hypothetical protein [Gammaproteobacteria bacterium]